MEFRFLTAEDASAYSNIRLEALESEPEAFGSSPEEHRALTLAEIAARISFNPPNKFTVGAFQDGRLLGAAGFFRDRNLKELHKGHIWGVYVNRQARGMGAGRSMLRMLLDHTKAIDGLEQVVLAVGGDRLAPANLYRSLGFEPYGVERRALKIADGRYIDEVHMVLFLRKKPE